jgi:hypothetical protein
VLPSTLMPTDHILSLLIAERDKLNRAIEALSAPVKRPGRPAKRQVQAIEANPVEPKKKRHISAAARRKMAAAQKKRWAAIKAAEK